MIAFFDASALIYLLQAREPFASRVRAELQALSTAIQAWNPQSAGCPGWNAVPDF